MARPRADDVWTSDRVLISPVFPPCWVLGALVLVSPLTVPADVEPSKSGMERQHLVRIIRDAELRWAQRCAWALLGLLVLAGVVAAITLAVLHS